MRPVAHALMECQDRASVAPPTASRSSEERYACEGGYLEIGADDAAPRVIVVETVDHVLVRGNRDSEGRVRFDDPRRRALGWDSDTALFGDE